MSINWGGLFKAAAGFGLAPFTGGATLPVALTGLGISGVGDVLGGLAQGRTRGRQAEAAQTLSQDELRQRLWEAQTARLLDRQRLINEAPNRLMGQATRGDLLSNMQDVNIPDNARVRVAHFTGGIRPSALGQNARQAGAAASALSLNQLQQPNFGMPAMPSAPELSTLPQANMLDKLLGIAAPAASLAGIFANARNPRGIRFDSPSGNSLPSNIPLPSPDMWNRQIPLPPDQAGVTFPNNWMFPGRQGGY